MCLSARASPEMFGDRYHLLTSTQSDLERQVPSVPFRRPNMYKYTKSTWPVPALLRETYGGYWFGFNPLNPSTMISA